MIQLDTSGIDAFNAALSLELLRLDQEISTVFQGWTQRIFTNAVEATPQFSSDTVQNWRYAINQPDFTYEETTEKYLFSEPHNLLQPHGMGDPEGVEAALDHMRAATLPTWRDTVYITNNTPIAQQLQTGQIKLRPVNLVNGPIIMLDYAVAQAQIEGLL